MPWLTNKHDMNHMLAVLDERGLAIDFWWQNEEKLLALWEMNGWERFPKVYAIDAGDLCAWIYFKHENHLSLTGFAKRPVVDQIEYDIRELSTKGKYNADLGFITQWTAKMHRNLPNEPIAVGDRVAVALPDKQGGQLGLCKGIDAAGRCTLVQLEPDGPLLDAQAIAKRWFRYNSRDEGFDWYWNQSKTHFSHYMAMLGSLAGKQRTIDKRLGKPAKPVAEAKAVKSGKMNQAAIDQMYDDAVLKRNAAAEAATDEFAFSKIHEEYHVKFEKWAAKGWIHSEDR